MSNFIAANPFTDSKTANSNQARLGTPLYEHPGPLVLWRKAFNRALDVGHLCANCIYSLLLESLCPGRRNQVMGHHLWFEPT